MCERRDQGRQQTSHAVKKFALHSVEHRGASGECLTNAVVHKFRSTTSRRWKRDVSFILRTVVCTLNMKLDMEHFLMLYWLASQYSCAIFLVAAPRRAINWQEREIYFLPEAKFWCEDLRVNSSIYVRVSDVSYRG